MSLLKPFSILVCLLKFCVTVLFATGDSNSNQRCFGSGVETPGWTVPRGDITIEYGTPLEIYCTLDMNNTSVSNYTAEDIIFKKGDHKVDNVYVTVMNVTTARLYMTNLPVSIDIEYFYCTLDMRGASNLTYYGSANSLEMAPTNEPSERLVCLNAVVVGRKPNEVTNIKCTSHHWEAFSCEWQEPNNGVKTNYSIFYTLKNSKNSPNWCPVHRERSCEWTLSTNPQYRRFFEYLYIHISGSNKFGNSSQTKKIHHYAYIEPAPLTNAAILSKTNESIYLEWNIGILDLYDKGLVYNVNYTCNLMKDWKILYLSDKLVEKANETRRITITKLFANTWYDFRISVKTAVAGPEYWSKPTPMIAKTLPCLPYESPETDPGSFEIFSNHENHREVLIYWKQIPIEKQNGDEFRYKIEVFEDNVKVRIKPSLVEKTYAKFDNLSFNAYRFHITSVNAIGEASYSSVVFLPRKQDILPEPVFISKVDTGNNYRLIWKLPNNTNRNIKDITVFSCQSNRGYPYPCTNFLEWEHKEANSSDHVSPKHNKNAFQYAISINSNNSSSGMVWALCTVIRNAVYKIKNVWISQLGAHYIDLRWKLDCHERAEDLKGFSITYCPVSKNDLNTCRETEKTYLVPGDGITDQANITNLLPFTIYKISIAMITDKGVGPPSEPLYNRTQDGAPEMKNIKVEVFNITDSTAVIKWEAPISLNGLLDHYEVYYNNDKTIVNETSVVLTGLKSYDLYHVRVVACTAFCSTTEPLALHTKIGIPGQIANLTSNRLNSMYVELKWGPPTILAGPNPVYDVKVQFDEPNKDATVDIFETSAHRVELKVPCKEETSPGVYTFFVRAKNKDESNVTDVKYYLGSWSTAYSVDCMNTGTLSTFLKIALSFVGCSMLLASFIFFGKKGFYKCQQMKKVEVVLPAKFNVPKVIPGEEKNITYQATIQSWTDSNEIDHLNKLSEADQNSTDCIDLDLDTDRDTSRSSSGCYTN